MRTAAYARFSSDMQRQASIEDQLRNVRKYCERASWSDPVVYTDAATSGSRNDRRGYQELLRAAERREFEVILVDDLSRLSRDELETKRAIKMLRFWGIRLIGVSDGIDTDRKGHKLEVGLRGLMGELYLDDLADKTHRGLMGRALQGFSAGGMPYGYRSVPDVHGFRREIDQGQAKVVLRIFERFAAGNNPRTIADELNAERIPSPRGSSWCVSGIYGDRRGVGILANTIYIGRWVWNRSQWTKDPVTGRRRRTERPQSDWVTKDHPDLRIVPQALWEAVHAKLYGRRSTRHKTGRGPKYLFSGLLKCGECAGPMVVVDAYRYGCATHKNRGASACSSDVKIPRAIVEDRLLAGVKADLLTEDAFQYCLAQLRQIMRDQAPNQLVIQKALHRAEQQRDNIMTAIKEGILTPTTKDELLAAEAAIGAARQDLATIEGYRPEAIMPRARDLWRRMTERLEDLQNVTAARQALTELLGTAITIKQEGKEVFAEVSAEGIPGQSEIIMVAGARYVTYLNRPRLRVRLR